MLALYLAYLDDDNDQKLFEDMFLSYRKQMVTFAVTILGNEDDAQDAVGDVFLRIAQKNWDVVRDIKNETDLRNYLLKSTKNTALNKIKSKKKENVSLDTIMEYDMDGIEDLSDDTFLELICNKYEYDEAVLAIGLLNEKYRDAMYCHYVMEMTVPQTAKSLNQKLSTTKQQLVRGKKMLLSLLGKKGDEKNGDEQN
ncbi:MAG: sigma-70 family RNA polymerase sigma factor [Acutalibacteraceae bacterium]|nr:sigma-70 family RNA polymerase sigma factor [Acutalibacteraceae bacterium]